MTITWLVQRLIDLLTNLATWYYNRKYGALASRLGGGVVPGDGRRGFIVIQIDGLAHEYLLAAMESGAAPFLSRLRQQERFRLQRWRCGLPSSTPAVQAGIMFGNNWDIPSFRWYEKESGQSIVCKVPAHVKRVQDRLAAGRYGILTGGSSYFNIFDGSARTSLVTLSALGGQHFFENVRGSFFFLLFLLSPRRALRTVWLAATAYLLELWQRLRRRRSSGHDARSWLQRLAAAAWSPLAALLSPLWPVAMNVIFREIQTFAVGLDIYRGVPAIYTDYYGYDDMAHHHGPESADALAALRAIDDCIRQIDQVRRQFHNRRPYDLIVLSDHGMTRCRPFRDIDGRTLGEFIRAHVGKAVVDEQGGETPWSSLQDEAMLAELAALEQNVSPRTRRLVRLLRRALLKGLPKDPEAQSAYDLARRSDVVVRVAGSLAHIYFNVTPGQMEVSEIAVLYPDLLHALMTHAGIGLVLGREQGSAMVVTTRGVQRLSTPKLLDDLAQFADPARTLPQLERLVRFPHSGDLVVLGAWYADETVVGFEDHAATHGGLGGPQEYAFFLGDPALVWDLSAVDNAWQLHEFFMAWYGDAAARAEAPARADV